MIKISSGCLQVILQNCCHNLYIRQFCSSLPSRQSILLSHLRVAGIQSPLLQVNSSALQTTEKVKRSQKETSWQICRNMNLLTNISHCLVYSSHYTEIYQNRDRKVFESSVMEKLLKITTE